MFYSRESQVLSLQLLQYRATSTTEHTHVRQAWNSSLGLKLILAFQGLHVFQRKVAVRCVRQGIEELLELLLLVLANERQHHLKPVCFAQI